MVAAPLELATFGDRVGERWLVGDALLEVVQPRFPCFKLGMRMGDARFVKRFEAAGRPGVYLRIVTPGTVGAGDLIAATPSPFPAAPTIADLFAG